VALEVASVVEVAPEVDSPEVEVEVDQEVVEVEDSKPSPYSLLYFTVTILINKIMCIFITGSNY
jgi:hypothetical protein